MISMQIVLDALNEIAPLATAESWDNVGLLVGDADRKIARVMTCLTLTSVVLDEAIGNGIDLIVTHHPIPFKPISRITSESTTGRTLLRAIENRVAIYSPHTAWDNAKFGINQQLADCLDLCEVTPLYPFPNSGPNRDGANNTGVGRCGTFREPKTVEEVVSRLKEALGDCSFKHTHSLERQIRKIGIVCGSGGSFVDRVLKAGCDAMLTGEATYHQCLEAEANGVVLLMAGHHASEFFAMKRLAELLAKRLPGLFVSTTERERSFF